MEFPVLKHFPQIGSIYPEEVGLHGEVFPFEHPHEKQKSRSPNREDMIIPQNSQHRSGSGQSSQPIIRDYPPKIQLILTELLQIAL